MLGMGSGERESASRRFAFALALAFAASVASSGAHAQERRFEMQLFLPPAAGGTTFSIARPTVPRHLNAVFGLGLSYANEPFRRFRSESGGVVLEEQAVVRHLAQLEAYAALGLFEWIELGVAVPVGLVDAAEGQADARVPTYGAYGTYVGLADLRLSAAVPLVRGDFALAARFVTHLPTGDFENYLGMEYWIATPSLAMAWDPGPLTIAAEVGYRLRQRRSIEGFEQDDDLVVAVGLNVPVVEALEIIGESHLRIGVAGHVDVQAYDVPWEVGAGVRILPIRGMSIDVGGGTSILAGAGAPLFRVFASLRFATEQGDSCVHGPEDYDGFEDGDFCADPDNDGDGIPDESDRCPNDPEDLDGFADDDGCPDLDNDADGVPDATDACPNQSEDRDGFEDDDGCPEPDNDGDGIPDGVDDCPMEPEDLDGYEDDDGCPEPGPDGPTITVTDTRILISERIYFDYDRDTIRSVSMPMLDQVAETIRMLPASLRIRVDGYTDNQGNAAYNLDLSFRRARAVVEYLVGRGVPRPRLEYRGYGVENPVAPNDGPEGYALNRRVEFTILHEGEDAGGGGGRGTGRRRREP
ncbi:MAG: OmpA family protein [Sandaracinaceae bacterium]|nr:OmpA family protein [Sandaracinaceae bacterium]